jgi:hypothetical protein
MTAREWPNQLGYDVGATEVWKFKTSFGVRVFRNGNPWKFLEVPFTRTSDPIEAARLARQEGIVIE